VISSVLTVENKNQAQTMSEVHLYLGRASDGWMLLRRTSLSHSIKDYSPDEALTEQLRPYHEMALADAHIVIGRLEGGDLAPENEIAAIPAAQIMDTALLDLINEVQMYYSGADVSAAALALLLAFTLCAPAFAADDAALTRGEFVMALCAQSGITGMEAKQAYFDDVPMQGELALAVRWAVLENVVKGYGNGKFGPDDPITREQMATMLYRWAQAQGQGFQGMWYFPLDYPDAS